MVTDGWGEFGVAAAGATAALAGLLIVAISVNLKEIAASRALTVGSRSTIASLVLAIVVSLLLLVPAQPAWLLGAEALLIFIPTAVLQVSSIVTQRRLRAVVTGGVLAFIVALAAAMYVPFLVGGLLLVLGSALGVWLLAGGIVIVVIASMINAWVLLIEVQRG